MVGGACAHGQLVPGASAQVVADAPRAAVAVVNDIRVVADCDDWRDLADRLPKKVTPIKVRIVNHSQSNLRVLYESFELLGRHGRVYRALPVIPLDHSELVAKSGPVDPMFAVANFQVAPRYHDVYPSLDSWPTPLARDEATYTKSYRQWGGAPPQRELRRMALPEGVLGPGGEITGYLYFENPIGVEDRVTFRAEMDAGRTDQVVATIKIPLRVD
jgi:hypothetical protein